MATIVLARVPSVSHPEKFYAVSRNTETGVVSCNCPSRRRPCPHVVALLGALASMVTPPPVADLALPELEAERTRLAGRLDAVGARLAVLAPPAPASTFLDRFAHLEIPESVLKSVA